MASYTSKASFYGKSSLTTFGIIICFQCLFQTCNIPDAYKDKRFDPKVCTLQNICSFQ